MGIIYIFIYKKEEGDLNAIKNMIANTRKPMNRFGERFFMKLTHSSDESSQWCFNIIENKKLPFKEQVNAHNLPFYSLSSSSKVIDYKYLPAMENFHEWLKTFLDKAIRDAEDSVYNYNNVQCRRATSILREHEQSYKIKKDKYELLSKGKADILNYLQSMYDSMNIFYHQTINFFPESDSYK
ncbi:hypothetical protein H8356DRAFT_1436760 [Neocallimastix lanati (nom. inval.)]|nr:hypothetical protein H8356DRAFT_1342895 [Neocallimastix sp. JGI-2020a]KAG4083696.1 hypothetical protein H8356DRAFT_1436760 [Neocallimastix sp. JGI-2020a]